MVLPLLAGLAGSALAGAGVLGAMSPLVAGSIGSGIGAFVETGDPMDALTAGAASAITGGLLGGTFANAAGRVGTQAAGQAAGQTAGRAAGQAAQGLAPTSSLRPVARGTGEALARLGQNSGGGIGSLFGKVGQQGGGLLGAEAIKGYTGALGAQAMMPMPMPDMPRGSGKGQKQAPAPGRSLRSPTSYVGREFDYRVQPNYSVARMNEGGLAALAEPKGDMDNRQVGGRNAKQVVSDAIAAIEGSHPSPEMALGAFLAMYGEDKLRALIKDVTSGQARERRLQQAGLIRGPEGAGDMVPANIDGAQDVLLEDGEFVMTRDAVDNLGGGDNAKGGQRMMELMAALEAGGKVPKEMMA